ncbi:hypothetical protein ACFS5L_40365 [Streptomyces phyllanthi]|uniref:Uncharacterized protein n=1 Tax=Streptomyces phyllanthi TaxID=1803180 RepID=A0A5N8WFJ6_9ACTN|nr:hypothetical protein [Streptomyces phyllanthi]MPY45214.1 hypothetical protein [Streptomyces phyllanthi]
MTTATMQRAVMAVPWVPAPSVIHGKRVAVVDARDDWFRGPGRLCLTMDLVVSVAANHMTRPSSTTAWLTIKPCRNTSRMASNSTRQERPAGGNADGFCSSARRCTSARNSTVATMSWAPSGGTAGISSAGRFAIPVDAVAGSVTAGVVVNAVRMQG